MGASPEFRDFLGHEAGGEEVFEPGDAFRVKMDEEFRMYVVGARAFGGFESLDGREHFIIRNGFCEVEVSGVLVPGSLELLIGVVGEGFVVLGELSIVDKDASNTVCRNIIVGIQGVFGASEFVQGLPSFATGVLHVNIFNSTDPLVLTCSVKMVNEVVSNDLAGVVRGSFVELKEEIITLNVPSKNVVFTKTT